MVDAFRLGMLGVSDIDPLLSLSVISSFVVALYVVVHLLISRGVGVRS